VDVSPAVVALGTASMLWMIAQDAQAQPEAPPDDLITRPLVLAPGTIDLRLTLAINVQPRAITEPTTLSPDAWLGILPRLTIGLTHSDASLDQIATSGSFCVKQSTSTCEHTYKGSAIDVRFSAMDGPFAVAPRLRAVIRNTDPFKPAVMLGALLRWTHGRFAITSDPSLRVPLANASLGNYTEINLPVWLAVQPAAGWMIAARGGYESDVNVIRDGGHIPFALDVAARATPSVDVSLEGGWASLLGPLHDARHATIMLAVGWHGAP
jgi:hypothetical protein